MKYTVGYIREQGFEAHWTRNRHRAPIIVARWPGGPSDTFWAVTGAMWERAKEVGLKQAFDEHTVLGKFFSVAV